ncbi:MAG: DHH family phosphoesterase [Spirochaetales bacterium]|nr:MAG: DHH family phosphoesterase [Spirochaetales bacterium]
MRSEKPVFLKDTPQPVLNALDQYEEFFILGHEEPDADCLCSQRVLGSWLSRRGKTVHLCSAGPWRRPEIAGWQPLFNAGIPPAAPGAKILSVILDCSSFSRTGFPEDTLPKGPVMVIDHHATSENFGDFRYLDPQSPSATLLVQKLMESAGDPPTQEEAQLLFMGFCTDTGFFRHVEPWRLGAMEGVARLVGNGASPPKTFQLLNGGRSPGSLQLLGRILERIEIHFNGRLALSWERPKDRRELGKERDSDMMYQLLLGISGVEAAAVIREQNNGTCVAGLRSLTDLDVSEIAGFFGGGGHRKAAGCAISGDLQDAKEHLLTLFADRLK